MNISEEQQLRKEAQRKATAALELRKRNITIRSEYTRTLGFPWTDPARKTAISLAAEYDLPIETIKEILKG